MTSLQTIPLNRLVQSKSNVRHTGRGNGIDALMASIEAHGLRQNLNVKPTTGNRFEVVAGGRRLEALRRLAKEGRLDASLEVWCAVLADGDDPVEISLTENISREAMHPDDECNAFQTLIGQGKTIDDVAARFGVTPAVVRQRLKLASVSPSLRTLFRAGTLDLSQMMAFALIDDHTQQEAAWNDLPEWSRDADDIRRVLTREGIPSTHRLAVFVGLEAYEAAGGIVLRDLFDEEQAAVLADAALVEQLAIRKLEEAACYVKAEGWNWVNIELSRDHSKSYGRVYPQTDDESDHAIYAPDDLARAGARVSLSYNGELSIERGLVDRDTLKDEQRAAGADKGKAQPGFAATVIEDLTAHRTAALRLELAHSPAAALAATVHVVTLDLFYAQSYRVESCLDLSLRSERLEGHVADLAEGSAHAALEGEIAGWQSVLPTNPADLWDWCLAQDQSRLLDLLALLAGLSVNAVRGKTERPDTARLRHADHLAATLQLDMHSHWQPTAQGFFSRLPKGLMAHLLTEAGEPQQASVLPSIKKAEAAQRTAATLLPKGWLPAPMLIAVHEDPVEDDEEDDDDGDDDHGHDDHAQEDAA